MISITSFKNTPVDKRKQLSLNTNNLLQEITKTAWQELQGNQQVTPRSKKDSNEVLASKKGFQSMLFITPPKIHEISSPSPSPLIDIMQSINHLLSDEDQNKMIDNQIMKLLEATPVQCQETEIKQFIPKKSSRNISMLFWDSKNKENVPVKTAVRNSVYQNHFASK